MNDQIEDTTEVTPAATGGGSHLPDWSLSRWRTIAVTASALFLVSLVLLGWQVAGGDGRDGHHDGRGGPGMQQGGNFQGGPPQMDGQQLQGGPGAQGGAGAQGGQQPQQAPQSGAPSN